MLSPVLGDVLESGFRAFSRRGSDPGWEGPTNTPEFFAAARAGDKRALSSMKQLGYGSVWKHPGLQGGIEREVVTQSKQWRPGGALFGRPYAGLNRFKETGFSWQHGWKPGLAFGVPLTALAVGMAPKGHMVSAAVEGAASTVGGMMGAAAGAFFGGVAGEWVGGYLGGVLGEKAGHLAQYAQNAVREGMHFQAGGDYVDTEVAYTQRQRAAMEIGQSVLNARQYLGKEARMLHE